MWLTKNWQFSFSHSWKFHHVLWLEWWFPTKCSSLFVKSPWSISGIRDDPLWLAQICCNLVTLPLVGAPLEHEVQVWHRWWRCCQRLRGFWMDVVGTQKRIGHVDYDILWSSYKWSIYIYIICISTYICTYMYIYWACSMVSSNLPQSYRTS